ARFDGRVAPGGARTSSQEVSMLTRVHTAPNGVATMAFAICLGSGAILTAILRNPAALITGMIVGVYLLFAIKVVQQWEKVALLRLGKYVGLRRHDHDHSGAGFIKHVR